MLFTPGFPGFARGLAPAPGGGFVVTTSGGQVARYWPRDNKSEVLADGLDQLYGVAIARGGAIVVAELGTGRVLSIESGAVEVLATGLRDPLGVAIGPDGDCLVSEAGAGRVVELTRTGVATVLDGLQRPQGILVREGQLYVVDAGAKELIAFDRKSKARRTIAAGLPVGAPPGVVPKPLRGLPPFSGPQGPFAGIAAGPDGALYVSADGEGSVLALRPEQPDRVRRG
jgi:glucose/arabinose dehydrogenase